MIAKGRGIVLIHGSPPPSHHHHTLQLAFVHKMADKDNRKEAQRRMWYQIASNTA